MIQRKLFAMKIALLLAIGSLLLVGAAGADQNASLRPSQKVLVYKSRRPALEVSITRKGNGVIRASVSAPGLCGDGERFYAGFSKAGAAVWPIDSAGRFKDNYGDRSYFRGRFDGDKVLGVFRESRLRNGGSGCMAASSPSSV